MADLNVLTPAEVKRAAQEKADREASVRANLNAEAERVMNESKPTPTQAEMDAIKSGRMHHDEKEDPDNPKMPSLGEQQARVAEAGNDPAPYRTRQMKLAADDRISASARARTEHGGTFDAGKKRE